MTHTAQEIAEAALASVEGEDLLIEAMRIAMQKISDEAGGGANPWILSAKMHLVCDRIMRGLGDRMAYERALRVDPEAAEAVRRLEEWRKSKEI